MTRVKTPLLLLAGIALGCGGGGGAPGPWQSYAAPGSFGINALWASAPDDVWAAGQFMLHFDGTSFKQVTDAPDRFGRRLLGLRAQ